MKSKNKELNIGRQILERIKKDNIEPKPRWQFLLKEYVVWFVGAFSLMIGSLAFAVVIYMVAESDWSFYKHISGSLLSFSFAIIPYFWLIFLIVFVAFGYYNFKNTKEGYRYRVHWIVLGSVISSMIFGSILHAVGLGQAIDDAFAEKSLVYERMFNKSMQRAKMWTNPEKGLLAGIIVNIEDNEHFEIMDLKGNKWNIVAIDAHLEKGVKILNNNKIRMIGEKVHILGKATHNNIFKAKRILPMLKPCSAFNENCPIRKKIEELKLGIRPISKFEIEKVETGDSCKKHEDCAPNPDYMIRSICPFTSRCIDEECKVLCEEPYPWMKTEDEGCVENKDCNCKHYTAEDLKGCVCIDGRCGAVVAE